VTLSNGLHSIIPQKIALFITTVVGNPNPLTHVMLIILSYNDQEGNGFNTKHAFFLLPCSDAICDNDLCMLTGYSYSTLLYSTLLYSTLL
jgi:hypothetical protein